MLMWATSYFTLQIVTEEKTDVWLTSLFVVKYDIEDFSIYYSCDLIWLCVGLLPTVNLRRKLTNSQSIAH